MATETKNTQIKAKAEKKEVTKKQVTQIDPGEKMISAIGYISFLCVLPLLAKPKSAFCQHHGKQALVIAIIKFMFGWVAIMGGMFSLMIGLLYLAVVILGFITAYNGEQKKMPIIGDMAEKLKW